jgi:hypothetical protein
MGYFINMKLYQFFGLLCVLLTLFSCAGRITGSVSADGSAVLSINMSLQPRMINLIRSLSSAAGQADSLIIDGPAIARSMSNAPGIVSVSLRNTTPSAVEGMLQLSKINDFYPASSERGFIYFQQADKICEININRNNGSLILGMISPEIVNYLEALMAPIATGEELSKPEYLELVTSFYNKAISDEIAASLIRAYIEFPGTITSVKGGNFSGRTAEFDISLLDLLVLETPLVYEVRWGVN